MILEQFEDRLVQILLAVAVLSGVLSAFEDDPHVSERLQCAVGGGARFGKSWRVSATFFLSHLL